MMCFLHLLFLTEGGVSKDPEACIHLDGGRYKISGKPFTSLTRRNLTFEDRAFLFMKTP
jgi:hypothetical protein